LIESELFGHERGAFTGATERRPGKFELASGGTVFLDEIGELPLAVQGKLLRVIEEKTVDRIGGRVTVPVDVRIVAATNRDLKSAAEAGEFRRDLYFRLAVFPVEIPPLRERGDDVTLLARHFAAQFGKELRGREATLSDDAIATLRARPWQGNVRELENAIERACILADSLSLDAHDLGLGELRRIDSIASPSDALSDADLLGTLAEATERAVRAVERRKITDALRDSGGNKTRAAEALGVSYKTLLTKIKDYEL
jgi:DNA-binding NtrC family response regulator